MRILKRNKLTRFLLRFRIARRILFKEKHIVALYITDQQLMDLIEGRRLDGVDMSYAGMMEHQALGLIQKVGGFINSIEIICDKATFEATISEQQNP